MLGDTGMAMVSTGRGIFYGVNLSNPDAGTKVCVCGGVISIPALTTGGTSTGQAFGGRAHSWMLVCGAGEATRGAVPLPVCPLSRTLPPLNGPALPPALPPPAAFPLLQPVTYVGNETNHCLAAVFANGTRAVVSVFGMDIVQLYDTSDPWHYVMLQARAGVARGGCSRLAFLLARGTPSAAPAAAPTCGAPAHECACLSSNGRPPAWC